MPRSHVSALLFSVLLASVAGCESGAPCEVPGVASACTCDNGAPGARVCDEDKTLGTCDCSGAIGLPNEVVAGGSGGAAGSSGAGGSGGTGGGAAGTKAPPDDEDSGVADPDAGGMAGSDAGPDAGQRDPLEAYRGCMTNADCDPDATCIVTPSFPTTVSVCAPACLDLSDCPVPGGAYDAVVTCVTGSCRLDCTPVLFAPLLSCPTGMSCIAPLLGAAACYDDGV